MHKFRKTSATRMHNSGMTDEQVQHILRHADVETTRRCYIIDTSDLGEKSVGMTNALSLSNPEEPDPGDGNSKIVPVDFKKKKLPAGQSRTGSR